jgi:hydroxymethylbilane synthase
VTRRLRVATRGSTLARTQTALVIDRLGGEGAAEPVVVQTTGDRRTDVDIWQIGGQGVFVKEVQRAVLEGHADVAVHSAKDLPSGDADGLEIGAFMARRSVADVLIGATLDGLAHGAPVATGSVRRRA